LPNGTVKKGIWEDNKKKDWVSISDEEATSFKKILKEALEEVK
jgi:hypothetical protein